MSIIIYNGKFIQYNGTFKVGYAPNTIPVVFTTPILYLNAGNISSYPGSGSTWYDISGYGNNATLTAATTSSFSNYAIKFNRSTNTRAIVSTLNLSSTPTITINMWVKFLSLPTGGGDTFRFLAELSENYNTYSDSFFTAIATELSTNRWFTQDKGNVGYNAKNLTTPLPAINTWYNFTVVYDHTQAASNERTFYIDGVNQTSIASTEGGVTYNSDNTNNFGNRPLYIGGRFTTAAGTFSSDMDLGVFQVYNTALSATEISQSYESFKANYPNIVTTNLTHLYDAGNTTSYSGTGTVWTNLVGSNNLALVNSPTFVSNGEASRFVFNGTNQWASGSGYLGNVTDRRIFTLSFILSFGPLPLTFNDYKFFSDQANPTVLLVGSSTNVNTINYNQFTQGATNFFADILRTSTGFPLSANTNYMMTYVSTVSNVSLYVNGSFVVASTEPFTATNTMNNAARDYGYAISDTRTSFMSMSFAHIMFYSSSLSATEVTQNYNALKGRYGI